MDSVWTFGTSGTSGGGGWGYCNVLRICLGFVCSFGLFIIIHHQYLSFLHSVMFLYSCSLVMSLCSHVSDIFIELHSFLVFWNFALLP